MNTNSKLLASLLNDLEVNFTNEENDILLEHYNAENYNQYYYFILDKVLEIKKFSLDDETIRTNLIEALSTLNNEKMHIKSDDDIIDNAKLIFKLFYLVDLKAIDNK